MRERKKYIERARESEKDRARARAKQTEIERKKVKERKRERVSVRASTRTPLIESDKGPKSPQFGVAFFPGSREGPAPPKGQTV